METNLQVLLRRNKKKMKEKNVKVHKKERSRSEELKKKEVNMGKL